jgi:hypothetical protein
VNATAVADLGPTVVFELTMELQEADPTHVELRRARVILESTEQRIWSIVTTCGQSG